MIFVQCSFCGREVKPTVHRREGTPLFEVDYYLLLTGELERVSMQNPLDDEAVIEFHKMIEPEWVYCCVDCFGDEKIRSELERKFTEVPEVDESDSEKA